MEENYEISLPKKHFIYVIRNVILKFWNNSYVMSCLVEYIKLHYSQCFNMLVPTWGSRASPMPYHYLSLASWGSRDPCFVWLYSKFNQAVYAVDFSNVSYGIFDAFSCFYAKRNIYGSLTCTRQNAYSILKNF